MFGNYSLHKFECYCKAAIVGIAISLALVLLAGITSWCKTGDFGYFIACVVYILVATPEFILIGVIPSAVAGAVGAAVGRSGRASACGAMILACIVGEYLWFSWRAWPIATKVWLVVLASAVGALAGGAGAVIGRTATTIGNETRPLQLSSRELVVTGLLAAILLHYIVSRFP